MSVTRRLRDNRGFTLSEMIIVMAIFVTVMLITSTGFKTIVGQVGQQSKSLQTEIGSVVGLELFRSDLQNAGYGLAWAFQEAPSAAYTEITASDAAGSPIGASFWPAGKSPRSFNDAPDVPRAVQVGNTTFNEDAGGVGSKYLVIKSLSVAPGTTQKKSMSVTYNALGGMNLPTRYTVADRDFDASTSGAERVIVIRNTFVDNIPTRQLQVTGLTGTTGAFFTTYNKLSGFGGYSTLTQPHSSGDLFQVYGVDPSTDLRMPFNRADYYLREPDRKPPFCADHTGTLYKALAKQGAAAGYKEIPLLECVADMQVVFGMGPAGSNVVNNHDTQLLGTGPSGAATAKEIREQLKEIRVYILAQEGKKDTSFIYPSETIDVGENFGGGLLGRTFNLHDRIGTDWQNYRWKLYTIVVRPRNLIQ